MWILTNFKSDKDFPEAASNIYGDSTPSRWQRMTGLAASRKEENALISTHADELSPWKNKRIGDVHVMVEEDRQMKMWVKAETFGILDGFLHFILKE